MNDGSWREHGQTSSTAQLESRSDDVRPVEPLRMRVSTTKVSDPLAQLASSSSPSSCSPVADPYGSGCCSSASISSPSLPKVRSKSCTTSPRHYEETCHPPDVSSIQHLFDNNKKWREKKHQQDAMFFERLAAKQTPRYLWIGCSDSRVPAEEVTGLAPGEMFVHRNVANLVVANDVSCLSVIQFAVEKLRVRDIIVCGHYGCGGVRAAMENKQLGLLDNWLRNIRDVCRIHQTELLEITNEKLRFRRIVEFNIKEQCLNMFKINMVQRSQQKYGFPRIHGLVYDIHSGELKALDIDFKRYLHAYSGIYRLHAFHTDDFPPTVQQMRRNMIHSLAEGHEEGDDGETISARYIARVMKNEPDLFTPQEVDASIEFAQHESNSGGDDASAFVRIEHLVEYFAPRAGLHSNGGASASTTAAAGANGETCE